MGFSNLLDRTVTVRRGGFVLAASSGSPPACAIAPADVRTVTEYAQQGVTAVYLVYSATDLEALVGDQLVVNGATYPVVAVRSFANAMVGPPVFVTVCGAPTA